MKLSSRSQSPAARSRQAQIDRENLILIKKLIALDNSSRSSSSGGTKKPPRHGSGKERRVPGGGASDVAFVSKAKKVPTRAQQLEDASSMKNAIVIPAGFSASVSHACLKALPEVPPAACHSLYTHGSATMENNFADLNGSTLHLTRSRTSRSVQAKIQDENKRLLQRILTARKSYSRAQWSEQERERLKLLRNISRHPSAPLRGSSSTSRLPPRHDDGDICELDTSLALRRNHSELTAMSTLGIRLDSTSFLEDQQHQRRQQRPLSASASISRRSAPSLAADDWSLTSQSQSCRKPAPESIVQRMRSMTMRGHEHVSPVAACIDDDLAGEESDTGKQEEGDDSCSEEDEVEALLRDLS